MPDLLAGLAPTALVPPGRYGNPGTGVTITLSDGIDLATVAAKPGQADALAGASHDAFGAAPPENPCFIQGAEIGFVGLGPGRWLALGPAGGDLEARLAEKLGATAAVCDQSDGYLLFDVAGSRARDALAKGVTIDLDPRAFRPGDAATTAVALIGVTFWQIDESPTYRFAVGRSFAPSFVRFLVSSAAEYGCCVGRSGAADASARG